MRSEVESSERSLCPSLHCYHLTQQSLPQNRVRH